MHPAFRASVLVCLVIALPGRAAGESWVGATVFLKRSGVTIWQKTEKGGAPVRVVLTRPDYRVEAEDGDRIQVRHNGVAGWFDKADAVRLQDAVAFFSERLRADPKDVMAYNRRGWAWSLTGKEISAIED